MNEESKKDNKKVEWENRLEKEAKSEGNRAERKAKHRRRNK